VVARNAQRGGKALPAAKTIIAHRFSLHGDSRTTFIAKKGNSEEADEDRFGAGFHAYSVHCLAK
jgi:hypothetical protein